MGRRQLAKQVRKSFSTHRLQKIHEKEGFRWAKCDIIFADLLSIGRWSGGKRKWCCQFVKHNIPAVRTGFPSLLLSWVDRFPALRGGHMMPQAEFDVFLSHNSADKPEVLKLATKLKDMGFNPWLDAWHLVAGEQWLPAIEPALQRLRRVRGRRRAARAGQCARRRDVGRAATEPGVQAE